jgi:hypothetical protein
MKNEKPGGTVLGRLLPMVPALLARPQKLNRLAWPMPAGVQGTRGAVTVLKVAAAARAAPAQRRVRCIGVAAGAWSCDGEPACEGGGGGGPQEMTVDCEEGGGGGDCGVLAVGAAPAI